MAKAKTRPSHSKFTDKEWDIILQNPAPPGSTPLFKHYWEALIVELESRDMLKSWALFQLETLCNLYVEEKEIQIAIKNAAGMFYENNEGRNGNVRKPTPEARRLGEIRSQILQFNKNLGFVLSRDSAPKKNSKVTEDEWS